LAGGIKIPHPEVPSFSVPLEGQLRRLQEDNQVDTTQINDRQKQVLANIARRLRRHADYPENLIRSGNPKKLAEAGLRGTFLLNWLISVEGRSCL
jgi:hypothetical protein